MTDPTNTTTAKFTTNTTTAKLSSFTKIKSDDNATKLALGLETLGGKILKKVDTYCSLPLGIVWTVTPLCPFQ